MSSIPPIPPTPQDMRRNLQIADLRRREAQQEARKPAYKLPPDRLGILVAVVVAIVLVGVVVWVLHTGGFGTPPPPSVPTSSGAVTGAL